MVSLGMWDKKRGVIYPRHYSTKLAELFGIYAGDGSLSVYRRGTTVEYRLTISGSIADYSYLQHVDSVIRSLFNLGSKVLVRIWKNKRWTVLVYRSKAVVTYFEENGFPPRRKEHLFIPDWVKRQDDFSASFVRGLFDTDGHIAIYAKGRFKAYPVISFKMKPKEIIADLAEVLKNLGFKAAVYFDVAQKDRRFNCKWIKNTLYLSGWRNFLLWKELIGSNNPKNLEKFRTLEEALIGLRKD